MEFIPPLLLEFVRHYVHLFFTTSCEWCHPHSPQRVYFHYRPCTHVHPIPIMQVLYHSPTSQLGSQWSSHCYQVEACFLS